MYKILRSDLVRFLIEIICNILGFINKIIPKKDNIIFFYDSKEVYLNNYALYDYLIKNSYNNHYKIYYSMPNFRKNSNEYENVYVFSGMIRSACIYLIAKNCFLDTGTLRIKPSKKQNVINLWHGSPLKNIGFMSNTVNKNLKKNSLNDFSKIIISSPLFKEIYKKSFNIDENKLLIAGQPRLDSLFSDKDSLKILFNIERKKYNKVIMWMTTYRISYDKRLCHTSDLNWSKTNLPILIDIDKVIKLNDYLITQNVLMIIKIHQGSVFDETKLFSLKNVKVIRDQDFIGKDVQLYEILSKCDALITDYSSVFFDYLLLNKPIGFIIDDFEDYKKNNGFVFSEPFLYMPGRKIINYQELFNFIKDINDGVDNYSKNRNEVNDLVNSTRGDNCLKILEEFNISINNKKERVMKHDR